MNKHEYLELVKKAVAAADAYYLNDDPIMSDYEYDAMMQGIKQFEKENPEEISPESPTQMVARSVLKSSFEKVTHKVPMLSLLDVFTLDDVKAFLDANPGADMSVEHKIDGLSMSATYKNGKLVKAETRGDGFIGEDITENAKYIKGLPLTVTNPDTFPDELEVRCEVYLPVDRFLVINKERELNGDKLFANPRNAAAGLLRTKDVTQMKDAGLECFVFNLQRTAGDKFTSLDMAATHLEQLTFLDIHGFQTVTRYHCKTYEEAAEAIRKIDEDDRPSINYWIDGAVVKANSILVRDTLGTTGKYPKWAVAFKYPPEEKETTITDIVLQTGRTGRITPVAVFEPILLAGTTVSKATLNNQRFIADMNVNIGDTVIVRKAAEIIPQIVRVSKKNTADAYDIAAQYCPCCGTLITVENDGMTCECRNPGCPAQFAKRVEFWASRDCMDIRGMGPAVIDALIEHELIKDVEDIYTLYEVPESLEELFGKKTTENLLNAIEASKNQDIDRLIKAFGIPGVGRHIGKELAKLYPDIFTIGEIPLYPEGYEEKVAQLSAIDGVGDISARAIVDFFKVHKNWEMIFALRQQGVNLISKSYKTEAASGAIAGMTFVITGTLSQPRDYFVELIEKNGGKVSGSVSKKTNYLLCGEAAGSKLDKAKALGVPVLTEDEFNKML